MNERMEFRYLVTSPDLNAHGTLHGGVLMQWADEAAGMQARKLTNRICVTRCIDNIDFVSKAQCGDIMRIITTLENTGTSSLGFRVSVKEDISNRLIANISKIVFVSIDDNGNKVPHGVIKNEGI